jgi:hypothetical protein
MPVYDEGMQCSFINESEPIFDDVDEEEEDNEQGDDGGPPETPVTAAAGGGTERTGTEATEQQRPPRPTALEDDWLTIQRGDDVGDQQQQDPSHTLLNRRNFLSGVVTSSAESEGPSDSSELDSLKSKVDLLQSKVLLSLLLESCLVCTD